MLVAGLGASDVGLLHGMARGGSTVAMAQGMLALRIRRTQDAVEVVIDGVGAQPVLQQRLNGQVWEGQLQLREPLDCPTDVSRCRILRRVCNALPSVALAACIGSVVPALVGASGNPW